MRMKFSARNEYTIENKRVGENSAQLSFTGTELYRFEVPIGRNANFPKKLKIGA